MLARTRHSGRVRLTDEIRNLENDNQVTCYVVPRLRGDDVWILRRRRTAGELGRDDELRKNFLRGEGNQIVS